MINLELGIYLPLDRYVNSEFLKGVLSGEKLSIKTRKICFV